MKEDIVKIFKKAGIEVGDDQLETPPDPKLGDVSCTVAFGIAKQKKKNPSEVAAEIAAKLDVSGIVSQIRVAGPYINFFFDRTRFAERVVGEVFAKKSYYGDEKPNKKKILIEFPAPNTNKPLHLGHLKNMALGESVSRILESQGYKVMRINLNNDRGVHICKSMLAYKKWGNNRKPNKKSDHFVGDFYVMFSKKENKKLQEEIQEMLKAWEDGDVETVKLWKMMNRWATDGFNETYKRFGLKHDKVYNESEVYEKGRDIVLKGLKKGVFKKDKDGNVIVDLGKPLGKKVLLRRDGTSIYITQDLYNAKLRYDEFKYDKSIYVVANEQDYHFKVLFKVLEKLGFKFAKGCYHLSYGMIFLPKGRMKSREGTVVDADAIMDDLAKNAKREVKSRHRISERRADELSEKIGLGALKYSLLKYSAHKNFVFNPDESISFEGETGPYLQYSAVRAKRILEKSKKKPKFSEVEKDVEYFLIRKMADLKEVIREAANRYSPHIITNYTIELAQLFSEFYSQCQVIGSDLESSRLAIVKAYSIVISKCLNLLGIDVPERM
jgi:arginyl-tRNA synthetase